MRPSIATSTFFVLLLISASACGTVQTAMAPAAPLDRPVPGVGEVPDGVLLDLIRHSELIVLATPQDLLPAVGSLSPAFQLGAKETWYNVKLAVDSVGKGKLGWAKSPDLGLLPGPSTDRRRASGVHLQEVLVLRHARRRHRHGELQGQSTGGVGMGQQARPRRMAAGCGAADQGQAVK